ncbi:universal stress protein [Streptomyces sp. NPDC088360]|uniref:universal stress protein n=1 Tax=Streptomyces sp. NPDC088360 TaxID=3154515 RepID=UPI00344B8FC1
MEARVVVGVSGSPASLAALRVAAEEARRAGRTLVALIAWEPPEGEGLYARRPDRAWAKHWESAARERLDRAFDEVFGGAPEGVAVERWVVRGAVGRAVCDLAAASTDDLVILGTRRGWGRARRYVQRHARCRVMTVPAPAVPRGVRRTLRRITPEDFSQPSPPPPPRPELPAPPARDPH